MKLSTLVLLWGLSAFAGQHQCMYNYECADDQMCTVDMNGRGVCEPKQDIVMIMGTVGQHCVSIRDCEAGLICDRPHGYSQPLGTCEKDTNHQLRE